LRTGYLGEYLILRERKKEESGDNCITRSLIIHTFRPIDQIKDEEMGEHLVRIREILNLYNILIGKREETYLMTYVDGRIILKTYFKERGCEFVAVFI
jgi:hypothetical protein